MMSALPCGRSRADDALHPLAHAPEDLDLLGSRVKSGRLEQLASGERRQRALLQPVELGRVVGAQLDEQRRPLGRQLAPLLRNARAARTTAAISVGLTISSTARRPRRDEAGTGAAAASMSPKKRSAVRGVRGRAGTVSSTASAMNASVPSEPDEQPAEDLDAARRRRGTRTAGSPSCS